MTHDMAGYHTWDAEACCLTGAILTREDAGQGTRDASVCRLRCMV